MRNSRQVSENRFAWGSSPACAEAAAASLAAIVVLALTQGKTGLLGLFRRMVRWRIPPGWYVVALLLPAVLAAAATVLNRALRAAQERAAYGVPAARWAAMSVLRAEPAIENLEDRLELRRQDRPVPVHELGDAIGALQHQRMPQLV